MESAMEGIMGMCPECGLPVTVKDPDEDGISWHSCDNGHRWGGNNTRIGNEERALYGEGVLRISAWMEQDDNDPRRVQLYVHVLYDRVDVGNSTETGPHHGSGVDAWDIKPPEYGLKGSARAGSPLSGILIEALRDALKWAEYHGSREMQEALTRAARWADPRNPVWTEIPYELQGERQ